MEIFPTDHLTTALQMFPGVGRSKETEHYKTGIFTWWDYVNSLVSSDSGRIGEEDLEILSLLSAFYEHYRKKDVSYFCERLPSLEYWRLWEYASERFCFLDIETTGIGLGSVTTVVSLFQNGVLQTWIRGKDLEFIFNNWDPSVILVTYNGKRFDIPFLEREFHVEIQNPHLDLMHLLHAVGIKGGLKGSEIQLGIQRPEEIASMDGRLAPELWRRYQMDWDENALEQLVRYNQEDTKNLQYVLEMAIPKVKEVWGLAGQNSAD